MNALAASRRRPPTISACTYSSYVHLHRLSILAARAILPGMLYLRMCSWTPSQTSTGGQRLHVTTHQHICHVSRHSGLDVIILSISNIYSTLGRSIPEIWALRVDIEGIDRPTVLCIFYIVWHCLVLTLCKEHEGELQLTWSSRIYAPHADITYIRPPRNT